MTVNLIIELSNGTQQRFNNVDPTVAGAVSIVNSGIDDTRGILELDKGNKKFLINTNDVSFYRIVDE